MDLFKTFSSGLSEQDRSRQFRALEQAALNSIAASNSIRGIPRTLPPFGAPPMRHLPRKQLKAQSDSENESSSSDEMSSTESTSSISSDDEKKKKSKKAKEKASKQKKRGSKKADDPLQLLTALLSAGSRSPKPVVSNPDGLLDTLPPPPPPPGAGVAPNEETIAQRVFELMKAEQDAGNKKDKAPGKVGSKVAFKRVDQVYDRKIGNYKLKETAHDDAKRNEFDQVRSC